MDKAKVPPPKISSPLGLPPSEYLKPAHQKHASIRKRIHGFSLISSWLGSGLFEDAGVEVGVQLQLFMPGRLLRPQGSYHTARLGAK